jgi:hypothetical protein
VNVLALDLASTTGWAWGDAHAAAPIFGHHRFVARGEPRAAAYRQFRLWLDLMLSARPTGVIVYESPALPMVMQGRTNKDTLKLLMGLAEHLEEWAYDRFELREAAVQQVRAHFIGVSNLRSAAAKAMTMERCRVLGWETTTSDEADACALWDYQCSFIRPLPLFAAKR